MGKIGSQMTACTRNVQNEILTVKHLVLEKEGKEEGGHAK